MRAGRFLRWSRDAFLIVGALALGYSGFVLIDAKLYQAYQAREFQRQLGNVSLANASAGGIRQSSSLSDPRRSAGENPKSPGSVFRRWFWKARPTALCGTQWGTFRGHHCWDSKGTWESPDIATRFQTPAQCPE